MFVFSSGAMRVYEAPQPDYSSALSYKSFSRACDHIFGNYFTSNGGSVAQEGFKRALYEVFVRPDNEAGQRQGARFPLSGASGGISASEAEYFRQMATSFNALARATGKSSGDFVGFMFAPNDASNPNGMGAAWLYLNQQLSPAQIKSVFASISSDALPGMLALSSVKPVNRPSTGRASIVEEEPDTSPPPLSSTPVPAPAAKNEKELREGAKEALESSAAWEQDPFGRNAWRYILAVVTDATVSGTAKSIKMPHYTLPPAELAQTQADSAKELSKLDKPASGLSNPFLRIFGGASFEYFMPYSAAHAASTDAFAKYFERSILPVFDAMWKQKYGANMAAFAKQPLTSQLQKLQGGTVFDLAPAQRASMESDISRQLSVPPEIAKDIVGYYLYALNDMRAGAIRTLSQSAVLDKMPSLKAKLESRLGSLQPDYKAVLLGRKQGAISIDIPDYIAPGCGPQGLLAYQGRMRDKFVRVRDAEDNSKINGMDFAKLQRELMTGRRAPQTAFQYLISLGILTFDYERKQYSLSPYKYVWMANGGMQASDTLPAGVPEKSLIGGTYGFRKLMLASYGETDPKKKAWMAKIDKGMFAEDRLSGIELSELSLAAINISFPPAGKGVVSEDGSIVSDGRVSYTSKETGKEMDYFRNITERRPDFEIKLYHVTRGSDGKEELAPINYYPMVMKDGKFVPGKPDMKMSEAEAVVEFQFNETSGAFRAVLKGARGKELPPGNYEFEYTLKVPSTLQKARNEKKFETATSRYRVHKPPPPKDEEERKRTETKKPEEERKRTDTEPEGEERRRTVTERGVQEVQAAAQPYLESAAKGKGNNVFVFPYSNIREQTGLPCKIYLGDKKPAGDHPFYVNGELDPHYQIDIGADMRMPQLVYLRNEKGEEEAYFTAAAESKELSRLMPYEQVVPLKINEDRTLSVDWGLLPSAMRPPQSSPLAKLQGAYMGQLADKGDISYNSDTEVYEYALFDIALSETDAKKNPFVSGALAPLCQRRTCMLYSDPQNKDAPPVPVLSEPLREGEKPKPDLDGVVSVGMPEYIIKRMLDGDFVSSPTLLSTSVGYVNE